VEVARRGGMEEATADETTKIGELDTEEGTKMLVKYCNKILEIIVTIHHGIPVMGPTLLFWCRTFKSLPPPLMLMGIRYRTQHLNRSTST